MALEVAPGIFKIDTKPLGHSQLVASYLVTASDGTALIDPGFPSSAGTVVEQIREIGVDVEQLGCIVLTHTHIDHAGAAGSLAEIAKNADVATHQRGVFYLKNSAKISGGGQMVFGPELAEQLGQASDIPAHRIRVVSDGDSIDLGDKKLTVLRTPGHSGDHISLFEEATGTLFPGDTACLHYPQLGHVLIPAGSPPIYHTDYVLAELRRFTELDVKRVLTPHFGEPDTAPAAFLADNIHAVAGTRKTIEAMLDDGLEFPQVVEGLRARIIDRAKLDRSATGDFLPDVWLRIMLKTGLMGYMADILKYARDLRPFDEGGSELEQQ